ncbi:MAG TPA: hypothetical protein VN903_11800, partial [Polyangia bacterium]|nr:hypothetical protein [Polyangia bacterium]
KGSGGFGVCKRDREGRCGWVHRPCGAPAQLPGSGASHVPPPRPGAPAPAPTRSCANLPRTVEDLRTWPVVAVCQPGGGPVAAAMTRVRTLGDGTFIFSGRGGCFRGRYTRCFSK